MRRTGRGGYREIDKDTEQRGAMLITIGKHGEFDITPCRLTDLENEQDI
ncbi:MAG: hypothetical protein HFH91_10085 [Lachnospiraceae bacterium]|nr:hypothetical protein [Lachnospiraceae bacterium]